MATSRTTVKKGQSGSKHPAYRGGPIKERILKRDDYTCQNKKCGLRDPEIMQVDHIKPIANHPELRSDERNLQTLCPNCHVRKTLRELKKYPRYTSRASSKKR